MGNQKTIKPVSRPASVPTPQGNQSARLLDANGNEKSSGQIEREKREAIRNSDVGKEIFSRLRLGVPSGESNGSVIEKESGKTFSQSMIDRLAANYQKANDSAAFIKECEDRKDKFSKAAKAGVALYQDDFVEWAHSFTPQNERLVYANTQGSISLDSASDAIAKTAIQWLYNLCKLSNNALFGNDAKYGRPAETGKNPKSSMFDDVKRGAKMAGFTVSNNERIKGIASIAYTAEDSEGKIREAISEIADAARRYNRDDVEGAGAIVYRLVNDTRFGLDDELVTGLIQVRLDGIQVAGLAETIEKATEQKEAFLNAIGLDAALQADSQKMLDRLKDQKAYDKEHSGIGGTRTLPTAVAPNTSFTDPNLNGAPDEVKTAITWRDKAERRMRKIAADEFNHGISDEAMAMMIDDLSGSNELTESNFEEYYSESEIREYFKEIAFVAEIESGETVPTETAETVTA